MGGVVVSSLLFLLGICAYAAANHLFIALRLPLDRTHLLFSGLCILAVLSGFSLIHTYQATALAAFVPSLKLNLAITILFVTLFPWFIAEYTGVRPMAFLLGFTVLFSVLFILNLTQPYSIQYADIQGLSQLRMPWGDVVTHPAGHTSIGFEIGAAGVMAAFVYAFYALGHVYGHGRKRTALAMMLALAIYLATAIEGVLARMSVIESVPLGLFGYLAMIIVMSMALSYELRQSVKRIQAILDYVPAVIYMKDAAGRYLMVNRHFEDLFHVDSANVLGNTDAGFISAAQANLLRANDLKVLTARSPQEFEESVDKDGVPHTYLSLKFPLLHTDGTCFAVCGVSTDITDRKHVTDALATSELKYRLLFECANDAIFIMQGERFVDCNLKTLAMFGCRREEIIGNTPMAFSPPLQPDNRDSSEKAQELIQAAYNGESLYFEWNHSRLDGQSFDAEVSLNSFESGSARYLLAIVRDITERKQAEAALRSSEQHFRFLVEQCVFSIQVLSPDGHTLQVNPAWEKLWGMTAAMMTDYNVLQDKQLVDKGIMPYIEKGFGGEATEIPPVIYNPAENPVVRGPVRNRWIRSYIYPIKDNLGAIREVILMHEDVTEKKYIEEAIRHIATGVSAESGKHFFHQLVLSLVKLFKTDYAFIGALDETDKMQVHTLAICAHGEIAPNISYSLKGTPCANVIGQHTCAYPRDVQRLFPDDRLLVDMKVEGYIATSLCDAKGKSLGIIVLLDSKPLQQIDQMDDILNIFAARASAELARMEADTKIRSMAYQDYLTGLANRALLHEHLTAVLRQARHTGEFGAMLLIDLDHFKTINDALGHDVGDEVLREVAHRIVETSSAKTFVARLGGDEFVVLSELASMGRNKMIENAQTLADKIMERISSHFVLGERVLNVGASIGAVVYPNDEESELDILRHADMALYRAKSMGRNNIQFYLPGLQAAAETRLKLEEGLRNAVRNDELELYFQPLVNASSHMIGAEVLLRWHHPRMGDVEPSLFIPVAEETGLIHAIGEWVFDQACIKLNDWLQSDVPFTGYMSINVCPWQFVRPDFVKFISEVLAKRMIDPGRMMLEVTETALLYDLEDTIEKLNALRSLGLRIGLDDFGTGYSSLAYLKDLPLDLIKIDKAFIGELTNTSEHPLVETIIAIGRHMRLGVIAEGVESEMQRDILIKLGCENFQGYYFCKPVPEMEFLNWMASNSQ